jgi:hypothetical protein
VTCPTVGPALDRIACELHETNQGPSLLDRLLDPSLIVSLVALVLALASFLLAARQRREANAREGRPERARIADEGLVALGHKWRGPSHFSEPATSLSDHFKSLTDLNQIGAFAVHRAVAQLDDVELPSDPEVRDRVAYQLHFGAFRIYRRWIDSPFGTKRVSRYAASAISKAERERRAPTRDS